MIVVVFSEGSLIISLYPGAMGMYFTKDTAGGYEPLKAVTDIVKGCRVVDVVQDGFVPVMRMVLQKPFPGNERIEIIVSFYHEAPNFSIRVGSRQKNVFTRFVEKKAKSSVCDFTDGDIASMSVDDMLKNIEGIDAKMAKSLDVENLKVLQEIVRGESVSPRLVSLQPLWISIFQDDQGIEFSGFNKIFEHVIAQFLEELRNKRVEQDRRLQVKRLKRRVTRLQKKLLTKEEIDFFRECGELILANMVEVKKGHSSVDLLSPYTQRRIVVKLDPRLTPQANAQKYFLRYKKEKRGQPLLREQIARLEKEISAAEGAGELAQPAKKAVVRKVEKREPFHKFKLDSGSVVFVGKSAKSNDQLTFQQARSNDYFFHARGVEGAHTILRANVPKGQRPGKDEIKLAAAIAAYFSKAKTQKKVPVSFTQRKYLKKDKKGKPGSVIMMREEVIFVDPALPT
ncbi:MAG: DUF814 domain-containing protein [candidate division WOR-3 bacterium]|nr:MAG: DUF814 domain-containing protein [candidate division WOR-3 bacterium]